MQPMQHQDMLKVRQNTQPPDAEIHRMLTALGFTGPHYLSYGIEYHHSSGHIIFHDRSFKGWEHWDCDKLLASEYTESGHDARVGLKNHIGNLDLKQ
jgi:hypothetical protein